MDLSPPHAKTPVDVVLSPARSSELKKTSFSTTKFASPKLPASALRNQFKAPKTPLSLSSHVKFDASGFAKSSSTSPATPHPSQVTGPVNQLRGRQKTSANSPSQAKSKLGTTKSKSSLTENKENNESVAKTSVRKSSSGSSAFLVPAARNKSASTGGKPVNTFQSKLQASLSKDSPKAMKTINHFGKRPLSSPLPKSSSAPHGFTEPLSKKHQQSDTGRLEDKVNTLESKLTEATANIQNLQNKLASETRARLAVELELRELICAIDQRLSLLPTFNNTSTPSARSDAPNLSLSLEQRPTSESSSDVVAEFKPSESTEMMIDGDAASSGRPKVGDESDAARNVTEKDALADMMEELRV
ncbi:hypothetical protein BKA69DRAFT_1125575 [Paraphysoderma sedebokerense]|nr:hypothetical protein BKA69DRAFT_1128444 [Paraphysoderma sedebokerense]KAI9140668.1 hypothetical protein BKA69DRAFT_1125575 [Paraphysoderma sedebokerense]